MRYRAIKENAGRYPTALMCRALDVCASGYYAWCSRGPSLREQHNAQLVEEIRRVHRESRCSYGSPSIWRALRAQQVVGRHRIARLMQQHGIRAKTHRRWRVTTQSKHDHPVAPNLLARQFRVDAPNRVWVSDITFLCSGEGCLYLAVVLELYSRAVVGWAMGTRMDAQLPLRALRMAIAQRRPASGLIHHSDQGVQYASGNYQAELRAHGIQCSMSRKANCWDNAVAESFFATLKKELIHQQRYATRTQLQNAVFEWIEVFYNRQRRHSTLDYRSPLRFEQDSLLGQCP